MEIRQKISVRKARDQLSVLQRGSPVGGERGLQKREELRRSRTTSRFKIGCAAGAITPAPLVKAKSEDVA